MPRKKSSGGRERGRPRGATGPEVGAAISRRNMLRSVRNWGLGAAAFGATGWWVSSSYAAHQAEHDLARIGQGVPTVVQVHDPTCPTCVSLQREVRAAMGDFADDELLYLVASLNSTSGRALADRHDAGRVTLILFDAEGTRQDIIRGMTYEGELRAVFQRLADGRRLR